MPKKMAFFLYSLVFLMPQYWKHELTDKVKKFTTLMQLHIFQFYQEGSALFFFILSSLEVTILNL